MAGSQKEFELLFRLKASLGSNFNSTFKGAIETQKKLQDSLESVNSLQYKVDGYTKTSNAIEQQKNKLENLQETHERIAQRLQAHKDSVSRLTEEIEKNGDSTGALKAQLEAEKREVEKYSDSLKTNKSQIRQTTASIERNKQALKQLKEELQEAGVDTDKLEEANGRLQRSYERLQNSQKTIQRLNQTQQNINESISHTKTQLVGTVGVMAAAGAAIYNGPVKKAAEFQEQMSTVQAISGATGDDLERLSEKAEEMGNKTKFTAKEAGQAMEYMAMAGWRTKDMLGGIEGVMNLAAASGEELAAVSDIVTDAMTAFGIKADGTTNGVANATHFADVLAKTASTTNTDVGKMGKTFEYVAPVAGSLGYSLEDTATMIGIMANSGIKASKSGTALRSIMTRLSTDAGASSKSLGALGILTEKLGVQFYDSKGETRDLAKVIGETREAWKGLTKEEQNNYAKKIAGQSGISGFLALMNAEQEDFDKVTASINKADGAAEKMADIKLDNLNGQITLMQSAWDTLQVKLGKMLLPVLTDLIKKATEVLGVVTTFVQKNPEMTKTVAKVVAGLMAFRVGMLSLKLAGLTGASGIVSLLQKLMGLRIGFLESAATGTSFATKLKAAGSGVLKYFKGVGGALGGLGSAIGNIFSSSAIFQKVGGLFSGIAGKMSAGFAGLVGKLGGIAGKFLPIIGIITTIIAVVQILRKNFDKVREAVGNIFGEKGLEIFDKIVAVITNVGETIKGVFSDGNIGAARDKINEIFGEKGVAVFDTFAGVFQKIITAAGQFVDFVTTHIVPVVEQVFNVLMTSVIPGIISGIQAAAPVVMQIFQAIADFIAGIIPVIGSFIAGIMPIISEVITFIQTYVFPIISEVFNFIVSTVLPLIVQGIQQLGSIITTVLSAVLPVVQTVFSTIWSIIQPILAQILSTVQAVLPAVLSVFQSVFNAIGGVISAAQQVFNGLIQFITGVFTGNWSAAWEGVKSIFSGIWNGIKSICTGVINGIVGAVNVVIRGLNSLKVPDWVPGIGGKGISIPEIPQLAKGSKNTPQTFIAGERGPELITNAPGRTVFTAQQTKDIFNAQNAAANTAAAVQAAGVTNITNNNAPEDVPGVSAPELRSTTGQRSVTVTINNNPTIHVDGDKPGDLEEKLEENNRRLLQQVKDLLDKRDDDERRSVYA